MAATNTDQHGNQACQLDDPKLGSDIGVVQRRDSLKVRELASNRLSQRASILCMCQCDSQDCTTKPDSEGEQSIKQCDFHKLVSAGEGCQLDKAENLSDDINLTNTAETTITDPILDCKTNDENIDSNSDEDNYCVNICKVDDSHEKHAENVVNLLTVENGVTEDFGFTKGEINFEEGSRNNDMNLDECAPDVYGSECLASISTSGSLNSIYITSDDVEETMVDLGNEKTDSKESVGAPVSVSVLICNFDETLKCNKYNTGAFDTLNTECSDSEDSEDSEVELEDIEISVDDVDAEDADNVSPIVDTDIIDITGSNNNGNVMNKIDPNVITETFTEFVPVKLKSTSVSSRPLCSSTPLVKSNDIVNPLSNMEKDYYPTLSTFKPISDISAVKPFEDISYKSSSVPLCSSTPVLKQVPGLKVRDTNIVDAGHDKLSKRNIIDDILGLESCIIADEDVKSKISDNKENDNKEIVVERIRDNKGKDKVKRKDSKKDKKRIKGTRIEKFKEYMGPGLTCNPSSENEVAPEEKKDLLKNTDIETCTLTEYKGFGLTGPLPDKPLHASTPAPRKGLSVRDPNIVQSETNLQKYQKHPVIGALLARSKSHVINRPAGLEGFLLTPDGQYPPMNSIPSEKPVHLPNTASKVTLNPALLVPPADCMSGSSGQGTSGTSSALQPDDIYPSQSSLRSDKSDNYSTDKSDRSSKSGKPIEASVLQSFGQLKVSAYMNFGLLTVHVIQGRQLSTKWKSSCDSFVKMCLIPDDGKKPKCKTTVVQDSNNPLYDEKFSFELNEEDHCKRLMISVWHRDHNASVNEFLGCMSFGVRHLTNPKKEVSGWYYLLTEDIGRKKHLKVSQRQVPQLKLRHHANIPAVNKDVWGTQTHHLTLNRGKNGFGFSVVEACPVRVGRVDGSSPAEAAGLQPGDIIVRLNKQNVSRSTATSVAKLVKNSSNTLYLEIHRQKPITYEHLEKPGNQDFMYEMNENDYSVPDMNTIDDEDKENEIRLDDQTIYGIDQRIPNLATSTPLPLLARGHRTVQTTEMRKQEAIHRLLSLELDFIDLMHAGMQRYSRPLRHCILSHSQHTALFQNIEKLTTISEYHVKQMHDNAPSSFVSEDTDTSIASDNHSFMQSIGLIYQSKVHMLCQAYDLYAKGVSKANQILSDLQHNEDFIKFVQEPQLEVNQPSIKLFVYQPVKHIRDLYRVIQDIFLNTSQESSDYNSLKQVVEGLQECAQAITNYSCERIESMSSLTSRESKTSFTSSMKSRSSTCSSRSSSSKGHSSGPSCSIQKSIDTEVMKIQDKLVFSSNVPVIQLCQDDRHVVFSGDMFKWEGHQWVKVHMILFTDILLLTMKEADGFLRVIQEPTILRNITGMDAQRHHGTELVLYSKPRVQGNRKLSLRAPSTEQKYAWKSLIEQRVFAVRGSLEYYSSTSDVSSSSASAIII